jgi:hypothetical protein
MSNFIVIPKSREIPLTDFFFNLQLEYLSYKFRALLYERPEDICKFEEICNKKKEKIINIGFRSCHTHIFNDPHKLEILLKKFIPEWGMPNFCYRDDYQKRVKGHWDTLYYFQPGSSVRFFLKKGEDILLGAIINVIDDRQLAIDSSGSVFIISIDQVSRILNEDFLQKIV